MRDFNREQNRLVDGDDSSMRFSLGFGYNQLADFEKGIITIQKLPTWLKR